MSPSAPIPSDWKGFLRNDANKQDLFAFLAKEIEKCKVSGKQIVSTCHENVCSSGDISLGNLAPCTQEEADTRLLLHAADCVRQEHSIIIIRTSDTDVVVLAFSLSQQLGAKELWTSFETVKNISGILLSMTSPPSLDLTSAKHCLSSMPSQGVILFLSLQEGANSKHGKHAWLFLL